MSDPTIRQIGELAARDFGIPFIKLRGSRCSQRVVLCRHIAIYLARELTPAGSVEIGRVFNRDHSSVLYAAKRIEQRLADQGDPINHRIERLTAQARALFAGRTDPGTFCEK